MVDKTQLLIDLQKQGKRICDLCGAEITDPINYSATAWPDGKVMSVRVCHITCP